MDDNEEELRKGSLGYSLQQTFLGVVDEIENSPVGEKIVFIIHFDPVNHLITTTTINGVDSVIPVPMDKYPNAKTTTH